MPRAGSWAEEASTQPQTGGWRESPALADSVGCPDTAGPVSSGSSADRGGGWLLVVDSPVTQDLGRCLGVSLPALSCLPPALRTATHGWATWGPRLSPGVWTFSKPCCQERGAPVGRGAGDTAQFCAHREDAEAREHGGPPVLL